MSRRSYTKQFKISAVKLVYEESAIPGHGNRTLSVDPTTESPPH